MLFLIFCHHKDQHLKKNSIKLIIIKGTSIYYIYFNYDFY